MGKHNENDQTETNHEQSTDNSTRSRVLRIVLLAFVVVFALGNQRCPVDYQRRAPTLQCNPLPLLIEAGTCQVFQNPCYKQGEEPNGEWGDPSNPDSFELEFGDDDDPALRNSVSILTTRENGVTTRLFCVAANPARAVNAQIKFRYYLAPMFGDPDGDFGQSEVVLTIGTPLKLQATASPSFINFGGSSLLVATASGGVPPYFYSWIPSSGLDDHSAAPTAAPQFTTTYTVVVTDSAGFHQEASVTVSVGLELTGVTATPENILAGEASVLDVFVRGGSPPYHFSWTPIETLSGPQRSDPIALPVSTTTYHVTVTDAAGATVSGSVIVHVAPRPGPTPTPQPTPTPTPEPTPTPTPLSANFSFNVLCCPTLNLDASGSTGNIVSYTWDLSWTPANPDRITTTPTTAFIIQETNRGTITLTVTDVAGNTATVTRTFP